MAKHALSFEHSIRGRSEVYVAIIRRPFTDERGDHRVGVTAVRARRRSDGGYEIDRADSIAGAWLPWEPIDEIAYTGADAAKAAIAEWAGPDAEDLPRE